MVWSVVQSSFSCLSYSPTVSLAVFFHYFEALLQPGSHRLGARKTCLKPWTLGVQIPRCQSCRKWWAMLSTTWSSTSTNLRKRSVAEVLMVLNKMISPPPVRFVFCLVMFSLALLLLSGSLDCVEPIKAFFSFSFCIGHNMADCLLPEGQWQMVSWFSH